MPSSSREKYESLKSILLSYESVLVAFSGGADSALVAKAARDVLGRQRMTAATSRSESLPRKEISEVESFVRRYDIRHLWIETRELENPNYAANPVTRCYFCKSELYTRMSRLTGKLGLKTMADGTNADDLSDFRPGLQAAAEREVKSPLAEAGLHKTEIREISKSLGLSTWDKPAAPCLSSRIPYGQSVTAAKLRQIDAGEAVLKGHGFRIVRVRHFGRAAGIEVGPEELDRFSSEPRLGAEISSKVRALGFESVKIESRGYHKGKFHDSRNQA